MSEDREKLTIDVDDQMDVRSLFTPRKVSLQEALHCMHDIEDSCMIDRGTVAFNLHAQR